MRSRVVAGIAVVLGVACGTSSSPKRSSAEEPSRDTGSTSIGHRDFVAPKLSVGERTLEVLSFNINFGVGHDPLNVALVAEVDADLVLLQETTDESEAVFREALAATYPHILFRECCNAGGLGILSKQPIREEQWIEATVGWFPAWRVVVDTPVGPVQALDVHLRPPMSDNGSWVAGYFTTRDDRRDEMAALWPSLVRDIPTIVAGDFNEDERGRAVRFLADHGLVSALPQVSPRAKTWHWPTKVGELKMMLDHVVYGPGLVLHDAQVLERGNSDHYPLVVVLAAAVPAVPR